VESYPPVNTSVRQLTLRSIGTGMVLGGLLSLCNVYSGLKIGWSLNMSVTATLLGFGFWKMAQAGGAKRFGPIENNMSQTAASAAASVSSAGLVAPIPALAMLTDTSLSWPLMSLWVFSVMLVGVMVAIGLRKQMLVEEKLPFPFGIATGETIKEMYAKGTEAMGRVKMLIGCGIGAAAVKLGLKLAGLSKFALPGSMAAGGALTKKGITSLSMKNLTVAFDPSLLIIGAGALIGMRACASMLLGGIVAWLVIGPPVLEAGWAEPGKAAESAVWFGKMVKWMLWPGVAMMVVGSLTSFAFSWKAVVSGLKNLRGAGGEVSKWDVPKKWFADGLAVALLLSVTCQVSFFEIAAWTAVLGVVLTFLLAVVAARVSGETGITPVGPMGKVTQLLFGVIAPGSAAANLMAANVTGGAASQAGDLLHDLKTGLMLGAAPKFQALSQFFGIMAGATCGSAAYLLIIPDPKSMLLTDEWPAPAVAQWKAVAEIFMTGIDAMPEGTTAAMVYASIAAVVLAVLEKKTPKKIARWIPSGPSIGLAFCIPGYYALSFFIGGLVAVLANRFVASWSKRFLIVAASGLIAGESLMGVGIAIHKILAG